MAALPATEVDRTGFELEIASTTRPRKADNNCWIESSRGITSPSYITMTSPFAFRKISFQAFPTPILDEWCRHRIAVSELSANCSINLIVLSDESSEIIISQIVKCSDFCLTIDRRRFRIFFSSLKLGMPMVTLNIVMLRTVSPCFYEVYG